MQIVIFSTRTTKSKATNLAVIPICEKPERAPIALCDWSDGKIRCIQFLGTRA